MGSNGKQRRAQASKGKQGLAKANKGVGEPHQGRLGTPPREAGNPAKGGEQSHQGRQEPCVRSAPKSQIPSTIPLGETRITKKDSRIEMFALPRSGILEFQSLACPPCPAGFRPLGGEGDGQARHITRLNIGATLLGTLWA